MTSVSRFAVGVPTIDALHEECEACLARLAAAVASHSDATPALADLQQHLEQHFLHEESLMATTNFPPAGCHQREHASVLEVIVEVRRRYATGDRDPAVRLAEAMLEWFEIHAASMDAALASWLNAPRDAAVTADSASST